MKYKLVCVEEHCEWANNAEKHCIWPGSYCPKRDGKNPGLRRSVRCACRTGRWPI